MGGGRCTLHGPGAIRKWKPKKTPVFGEGGVVTLQYVGEREYYWRCDLGVNGKLKQTTLKFVKTTPAYEDNTIGDSSTSTLSRNFNSLKQSNDSVGQGGHTVQGLELNH